MLNKMLLASLLAAASFAYANAQPSVEFNIENQSSEVQDLAANSFPSGSQFTTSIQTSSSGSVEAEGDAPEDNLVGTVTYQDQNGEGCMFQTSVFYQFWTESYTFSVTPTEYGDSPECDVTIISQDDQTGELSATLTISGY